MQHRPKKKHKLLIEVLDEIPTTEDHYVHNVREEIEEALARIHLKVTWMRSYPLEERRSRSEGQK